MYNHTSLQKFIDKVNEEAEKAAQEVYDKYSAEFLRRVQAQIKDNDVVWVGMGTASIDNPVTEREDIGENLCTLLGQSQYWSDTISAGFPLPYNFTKHKIIKD